MIGQRLVVCCVRCSLRSVAVFQPTKLTADSIAETFGMVQVCPRTRCGKWIVYSADNLSIETVPALPLP